MIPTLVKRVLAPWSPRGACVGRDDWAAVERIRELAGRWRDESDQGLRERSVELQRTAQAAESPHGVDVLIPALALATEAARRALGINLYDVQLLAGLVLARGSIAQVQTGEGKTFVTALPAFCFALLERGVHVMTTNSYLAERDYALLLPMYGLLGVTAGVLRASASLDDKRAAYACHITYGPGYEFGFDFLRDRLAGLTAQPSLGDAMRQRLRGQPEHSASPLQRPCAFAVVDEADSVMIDEATTPLILNQASEPSSKDAAVYQHADELAGRLAVNHDFQLDGDGRTVRLTPAGADRAREATTTLAGRSLRRPWPQYVEQALRARWLYKREVDYVIQDGQVRLVDAHTGRIHENRSLRHGLQQAIEAAERVTITSESPSLAHISRQRYFRLYDRLCGTTGTVQDSEQEFWREYRLPVVVIPTHRPCQRRDLPLRSFADRATKFAAIVADILRLERTGQPVLVGTPTIWQSEEIARRLAAAGGKFQLHEFQLLNGKQDAEEAEIIALAGRRGAVTIATNMAGRGTDIKLGADVGTLGGLHVMVTEPNLSARSDRQLIGRAARQGDPGSSQVFVSADDDLVCRLAPSLSRRMKRLADSSGEVHLNLSRAIRRLQRQADSLAADRRRQQSLQDEHVENLVGSLPGGRASQP